MSRAGKLNHGVANKQRGTRRSQLSAMLDEGKKQPSIPETGKNMHKENVSHSAPSLIKSCHMNFNQSVNLST